jgi:hypothetical protein
MSAWFSSSVARTTAQAHGGSASLAVTATAGGGWGIEENWPGTAEVTAGTPYDISAWAKAATTGRQITLTVIWLDAADATVGTNVTASATDNSAGWTKISASATAPAGATHALFRVNGAAAANAEVHYLDDIAISTQPPAKVGDLNGDNSVNILDLSILLARWNTTDAAADLNDDNVVGIVDLSMFLSRWGT